jgi:hypothetical protein
VILLAIFIFGAGLMVGGGVVLLIAVEASEAQAKNFTGANGGNRG